MADALGIIGVIGVAGQILQLTVKFGLDWKDAPEDAKSFLKELQALKTALSETHSNILVDEDFKAAFEGRRSALLAEFGDPTQSTSTSSLINTCKLQLEHVLFDLKKRLNGHRLGWERLKGAFTAKKTRETVEDLQRRCLSLNSLISLDTLSLGVQTFKEVKQARQEQNDWQNEQRSREILDWLSEDDYGAQQSDFLRRRQAGTGQWLLDSSEYQNWVATPQTTLFCPGIPGAGKTTLTSIVVEDLQNQIGDDDHASMAYLYCNFRRQQQQTVESLLCSILRQLAQDQPFLPESVRSLYGKHKNNTRPSLEQLSTTLQDLMGSIPRVYILIDALDECQQSDGIRTEFLDTIFGLQLTSQASIFATSRFIADITDRFAGDTSLEIRAHEEDVRRYLEGKIPHLPACVAKSPDLQEEIVTRIIRAVDGMFLLAQLHFDSLKGKRSTKAIRQTLEALHTGSRAYDKAYDDAMKRITGQLDDEDELARKALMWIACAMRPLKTFELREALAIELGKSVLDPANVPELEDVVSLCAGLVTVDEESNIIRLVHYTTQEYFSRTSDRWFPSAHRQIAETCVTYLSLDMFIDDPLSIDDTRHDRLQPYMILHYAFQFWDYHASLPESEPCNQLVSKFFQLRFSDNYIGPMVSKLISECTRKVWYDPSLLDVGNNELAAAASEGNIHRVQYLLQRGARPNVCGRHGSSPLYCAAKQGHTEIVKFLLDWDGIDVNAGDGYGETPLHAAVVGEFTSIIDMLLETKDIDLDALNKDQDTLLHAASVHGPEHLVRKLLQLDCSKVNARDCEGETPLHWAARMGYEAAVGILLDSEGVEINARCDYAGTPLHAAASSGHVSVTRMLLNADGIEVNARDRWKNTPLHGAVSRGHIPVAHMLLEVDGIEVNTKNLHGFTLIAKAAEKGRTEMLQLLLDITDIDVNEKDRKGYTPLAQAASNGKETTVAFLLGVEEVIKGLDLTDDKGSTAQSVAVRRGHHKIAELIREASEKRAASQRMAKRLA